MPSPRPSRADRWYRGANEIPLYKFIRVITTLDLRELIIWGNPKTEDLAIAWANIYQSFLDGMQDKTGDYKVRLMAEINKLDFDYRMVQLCVQRLSLGPCEWAEKQLRRRVRVAGEFNPEDQGQYFGNLIIVLNHAISLKHRLMEKESELQIIKSREGGATKVTEQHFDTLITRVSLFAKYQIDDRKTTVSRFMELYRAMKQQEEALKKQIDHSKLR